MRFNTGVKRHGHIIDSDPDEIRRLPMFFRADADMVYRLGGGLYQRIVTAIPFSGRRKYISIDTRVHMLMPGWLPCIGGWHCDDFYRPGAPPNGGVAQPNLRAIAQDDRLMAHHWSVYIGNTSPTEYIDVPFDIHDDVMDSPMLYKTCNSIIDRMAPESFYARSGQLVSFTSLDFHRGTVATETGWRLFVRATESDIYEPKNEIRTQVQVYLTDQGGGW